MGYTIMIRESPMSGMAGKAENIGLLATTGKSF